MPRPSAPMVRLKKILLAKAAALVATEKAVIVTVAFNIDLIPVHPV